MKTPIKFDEYYLIDRVAVGGMAEVFKGITYSGEQFERQMAVKRVLPHIAEDQEFIEMFIDEAKLVSQLQHPNIPQIYHLGRFDQLYFISMEFISGQDLRAIFDRATALNIKLDLGICAHIIMEVCEALDYAHRKTNARLEPLNLIHRDISPQNIIVGYDGTVKLIDFGIAKATGQINQTQAGILKGKFSYMSPEQARGFPIDSRSDLFGLGAVLYEITTLERCFLGQSDFSTIERVRNAEYHPPRSMRGDLPVPLERIIRKSLAKSVDQRFQSAADLQESLSNFVRRHQLRRTREQVKTFMQSLFGAEIQQEESRLQEFRMYAAEHIPEAQQRHESRRFRKISPEELSREVSRPRFALRNEMKLSLEQAETGALDVSELDVREYGAARDVSQRSGRGSRTSRGVSLSRATLFILLALLTGSSTAAFSWLNRSLPGAIWVEDTIGWRSQLEVIGGDERRKAESPAMIDQLNAGEHQLKVISPSGAEITRSLMVTSDQTIRLNLKSLRPKSFGMVYLSSKPLGANVSVRGRVIGVTPLELVLPHVPSDVVVKLDGYKQSTVKVSPQSDQVISHHLELLPLKVRWRLIAEAPNARFSIKHDSGEWRPISLRDAEIELDNAQEHLLRVSAPGYESLAFKLSPSMRRLSERHLVLKPSRQRLETSSTGMTNQQFAKQSSAMREVNASSSAQAEPVKTREEKVKPTKRKRKRQKARRAQRRRRKRKERRAQTSSASQGQPGFLKLIAFPPAEVFIGGRRIGWTPLFNHKLSAGMHKIRLRYASGEEQEISQSISSGRVSLRRVRKK